MSSKSTHTLAGIVVGAGLCYFSQSTDLDMVALMIGSLAGASAPDWLEIAKWKTHRSWLIFEKSERESWIPHRTITHTVVLWLMAFAYSLVRLVTDSHYLLNLVFFGFCISGLTHLLLDVRTVMGVPFLPFGKRYHWRGFSVQEAKHIQRRSGWFS